MRHSCLRRRGLYILCAITVAFVPAGSITARSEDKGGERSAVIAANKDFYKAFREQDVEAMDRLWARSVEASVVHPGWNGIIGRADVMRSWRDIIVSGGAPQIYAHKPTVTIHEGMATVLCYEKVDDGYLVATNIFVNEDGAWRLITLHAAPAPSADTLFKGDPA